MESKKVRAKQPVTAAETEKADAFETVTELCTSGIERLAEVQKKGLEIAVRQNAEVASAWKKLALAAPAVLMLDLAANAFERIADTQKGAIDLAVEQTHTFVKTVKQRKTEATETIEEGKKRAKEAIEHSVAAQKTALDFTAKQAQAAFETAKQQLGYSGTPAGAAAEAMQRGIEVVVGAHKELLDEFALSALN
jgi:hypothetical protein